MKAKLSLPILGALALITLSCLDVSPEMAGVQHALPPEWRLEEIGRIGSGDDQALVAVGDVRLGPDGRLYVVQGPGDQIWAFGPEDDLQARIGRSGEGPGEFRSISGIGFRGDTLYVADAGLHRLSFFLPAGQFLTSVQWPSQRVEAGAVGEAQAAFITSAPQILLDDGTGLLEPAVRFTASPIQIGPRRTSSPRLLFHVGLESGILDTILHYEMVTLVTAVPVAGGAVGSVGCPFVTPPLVELMADGRGVILVDRDPPPTLNPTDFAVVAFGPAGDTIFARSVPYVPVPFDDAVLAQEIEIYRTRLLDLGVPAPTASDVERALRGVDCVPAALTPATALATGQDGTTWIRLSDPLADSVTWEVLGASGRHEGRVRLPARETVVAARGDEVVTRWTGEFDVPNVTRYRIIRGGM